jgi:hypothetical protein
LYKFVFISKFNKLKKIFIFGIFSLFILSCQKVDNVQKKLEGTWERIVFDHNGSEQWTFTSDNKIYVVLNYVSLGIEKDTVSIGNYTMDIVRYSHGTLFNKNIFRVPQITISDFSNYKYNQGSSNIYYPAYNTVWEIHQLDKSTLIITTDEYDGKIGGLEIREFYKE